MVANLLLASPLETDTEDLYFSQMPHYFGVSRPVDDGLV